MAMLSFALTVTLAIPFAAAPTASSGTADSVITKLRFQRFSLHWEAQPLEDCLAELGAFSGLNFLVAPALRDRADEPVNLRLEKTRLLSILKILADLSQVEFLYQDGVIVATTTEDKIRRMAVLRMYDVRATLFTPTDFVAPRMGLRLSDSFVEEPVREIRREGMSVEDLVDILINATGASQWEHDGVSIQALPGRILVRHTPAMQSRIERVLMALGTL